MPYLPAIAIDGAKGVGKTATAARRASSLICLDDPTDRALFLADPQRITVLPTPVLLDEWQREPQTWDLVRRSVDADYSGGRFLLTGSATPIAGSTIHSGAGRIARLRMRPMTLEERGLERPTVSLRALMSGTGEVTGATAVRLDDYVEEIFRSGFPGLRVLTGASLTTQIDTYLERIIDRDLPDHGVSVRRTATLRRWLTAYAAATSSTTTLTRITRAASSVDGEPPARNTSEAYRDALTQIWILDPLPGWTPSLSPFTRLQQAPKYHLADPSLAARLLGASPRSLLGDAGPKPATRGTLLGALFESLATLCVRVGAEAAHGRVSHLRTRNGDHEVDLVLERDDHKIVAIEVKLKATVDDSDVRHLAWLSTQVPDILIDRVIITTGRDAYRRQDGIAVVPLALIGA